METQYDIAGRTCLITGATSGIGRAAALALARLGARLVLVCRDAQRGEATRAEVRAAGAADCELLSADLASQASIRQMAAEFLAREQPLHVLINNAGVVCTRRTLTPDGIETVFAVNHLAPFLLTRLLLDRLVASGPARIVTVASEAHRFTTMNFDDLGGERRYRMMRVYGQSKLANILFTYELARRLDSRKVVANCLHPGAVATRLGHNNGRWAAVLSGLLRPFFRTPEQGAESVVYLAAARAAAELNGTYIVSCRPKRSSVASYDTAAATRLWAVSAAMTGMA